MARRFSTKTYGNDRGFSCCFRQWRATHSHCSNLHGYSLGFRLVFEADELDDNNWVQDFGGLKEVKSYLEGQFDHTLVVAEDDPLLDRFKEMAGWSSNPEYDGDAEKIQIEPYRRLGVCDLRIVKGVGCEMFAEMVYDHVAQWLEDNPTNRYKNMLGDEYPRVRLLSVEVFEHAGNSAIYEG
jgi:6-pyruvoyltetrahydropterin/6-carboxytetrahydropterin synthase